MGDRLVLMHTCINVPNSIVIRQVEILFLLFKPLQEYPMSGAQQLHQDRLRPGGEPAGDRPNAPASP